MFIDQKTKITIPGVKKVVTVSSGKGGVGKSSVSAWFAKYLAESGYKVGLLDADIYGPSIAELLGVKNFIANLEDGKIIPFVAENIKVASISFLTSNQGAFAWRGPMITKAIRQLFLTTKWDELDYLIIDTPPGTGDIHLSIFTSYKIDGAFIITTPAQISSIDVRRCIDLHQQFGINIHGIIENMSYYIDQSTKEKIKIFGSGAGLELSKQFGVRLIDSVELVPDLGSCKFKDLTKYLTINLNNLDL